MHDPTLGHVFGSDDEKCDILLDCDNRLGVSATHFRICLDWDRPYPDRLLLVNISENGTRVGGKLYERGVPAELSLVDLAVETSHVYLQIRLLCPNRDDKLFMANWEHFRRSALAAVPMITNMRLREKVDETPDVGSAFVGVKCHSGNAYQPLMKLGSGQSGIVQKVGRVSDGAISAMKTIPIKPGKNSLRTTRLLSRELTIVQSLQQPNITRFVDFLSTSQALHIVTEFAPHGDLAAFLDAMGGNVPEDVAKELCRQLLEALVYLHGKVVVHRDIKPANILIFCCSPMIYKLTDFGLSRVLEQDDLSKLTFCGSPAYCAPEVYKRGACEDFSYDCSADVWSLGVVLWEVLTGVLPVQFTSRDLEKPKRFLRKILEWEPDETLLDERSVSPFGKRVVLDMLERDPSRRGSARECLEQPWFRGDKDVPDRNGEYENQEWAIIAGLSSPRDTTNHISGSHSALFARGSAIHDVRKIDKDRLSTIVEWPSTSHDESGDYREQEEPTFRAGSTLARERMENDNKSYPIYVPARAKEESCSSKKANDAGKVVRSSPLCNLSDGAVLQVLKDFLD